MRGLQFRRFLTVGLFNTVIGYILIFIFQAILHQPYWANAIGFSLASIVAYFNHSRFTFRKRVGLQRAYLYMLITIFCYLLNLATLKIGLEFLPIWLAQSAAISIYVITSYFGLSRYGFSDRIYSETNAAFTTKKGLK
jgi:putative flippase GtrA